MIALASLALWVGLIAPQETTALAEQGLGEAAPAAYQPIEYGAKGLDLRSEDGNFHAHIEWRAQLRLTTSSINDGTIDTDLESREGTFKVNRARFKFGGHAYKPWLGYYLEYDFPRSSLLDLRFTLQSQEALQLRVGQWKAPYSRERVDSSGKQQFVDRSIANRYFTVDRQQGLALFGHLWQESAADSWYNLGVFSGTGRGGEGEADQALVLGRLQWNFLGRDLGFSQSDTGYRERPAASLAIAGAGWRGPYTSFSTEGGGQLPGFAEGDFDRYSVRQAVVETAWQYAGFSWQQEFHYKRVNDTQQGVTTELQGGYAQVGAFAHALFESMPEPLEFALRAAAVDPDRSRGGDQIREGSVVFNWFFHGHRNKLSLDFSLLHDQAGPPGETHENRMRLQWDISF